MRVAVGMSGGVDSAVAAALLRKQGHEVIGLTMRLWQAGRYRGGERDACFGPQEEQDIAAASAICGQLGIAHRVLDCAEAYEAEVLSYFRDSYRAGLTPNPCVRCNAFMKFGLLPRLARESGESFEAFATGHYARLRRDGAGSHLLMAADRRRDQSYFLYRLTQEQLGEALFPLGDMTKDEVRKIASDLSFSVKDKQDSQDFYSGDYTELVGLEPREGEIRDRSGRVLGHHQGYWRFTVGQRRGLGVASGEPLYVLSVNACRNEVVVGTASEALCHEVWLTDCHWLLGEPSGAVEVKVRSSGEAVSGELHGGRLVVGQGVFGVAPGQSAVIYRGDELLGGGVIQKAL